MCLYNNAKYKVALLLYIYNDVYMCITSKYLNIFLEA